MFQNWGFLLGEIWLLLLIAALLGLFCGWLIWGRCEKRVAAKYAAAGAATGAAASNWDDTTTEEAVVEENHASGMVDYDGDGVVEGKDEGSRPEMMEKPADGGDDLKMIKGIGPKLEDLCHSLGVYQFSQIASWGSQEIAWMDANLEGFYGRVSRDDWVGQAKILAGGGETEFSKRVDKGDVY